MAASVEDAPPFQCSSMNVTSSTEFDTETPRHMIAPMNVAPDQPSSLQDHQMLGYGVQRHGEVLSQIRDTGWLTAELLKDCPARWIRDGCEYMVESR